MSETCGKPSRGRYVQGCRCAACTKANNDYEKKRVREAAKEKWGAKDPYWTDAEPVRTHLLNLLAKGFTKRGICRDYGIPRATIHNILVAHGRTGKPVKRVKTVTALQILEIGTHTSFVYYRKGFVAGVYESLQEFCESTGKTMRTARFLCTPTAKKTKQSFIERVVY